MSHLALANDGYLVTASHPSSFVGEPTFAWLRRALAHRGLQEEVRRVVARRVPAADVEDVVQTVLCDALASPRPPADEGDLPPWLVGIARHKVADVHRRRRRETPLGFEAVDAQSPSPPVECREILRAIEQDAAAHPELARAFDWVSREAGGEALSAIAAREQLPATLVRQRVSRLRRWLRARWWVVPAVLLSLAGATERVGHWVETISPAAPLGGARYRVVAAALPEGLDALRASVLAAEISGALVELDQDRIVIHTKTRRLSGKLASVPGQGAVAEGWIDLDDGRRVDVDVRAVGDRLEVTERGQPAPPTGGRIVLEREGSE